MSCLAVIDIGKTNAKLVLVDESGSPLEEWRSANKIAISGPYPHIDFDSQWDFIQTTIETAKAKYEIDAILPVTHGATAALVGDDGKLILPILDYEFEIPKSVSSEYSALRPGFDETGSPGLPLGLNLGRQLYWQEQAFPDAFAKLKHILTLPQFWGLRLCGVPASEATSLGCHTDLWAIDQRLSSLVEKRGWQPYFPELQKAGAALGSYQGMTVLNGIHDSNASFLPHLMQQNGPFSVLSTGTWVIAMAHSPLTTKLDPTRDTLINTNASGRATPTARFMGGREYDRLLSVEDQQRKISDIELLQAAQTGIPPRPNQGGDGGPFPDQPLQPVERVDPAAAILYLGFMASECLKLIGAQGPIVVEGPFAKNNGFLKVLSHLRGAEVQASEGQAGTTAGAFALWQGHAPSAAPARILPDNPELRDSIQTCHRRWLETSI